MGEAVRCCYWCGRHTGSDFRWAPTSDPVSGEEFVLIACCSEHLQALQQTGAPPAVSGHGDRE